MDKILAKHIIVYALIWDQLVGKPSGINQVSLSLATRFFNPCPFQPWFFQPWPFQPGILYLLYSLTILASMLFSYVTQKISSFCYLAPDLFYGNLIPRWSFIFFFPKSFGILSLNCKSRLFSFFCVSEFNHCKCS